MSENFENMTVLELRRVAKEMGVTLGGGISKQGIVDKLRAASQKNQEESAPVPAEPSHIQEETPEKPRIRSASIIADEDDWSDADDVPVLTPNYMRPAPRVPAAPISAVSPAQPVAPQTVSAQPSSAQTTRASVLSTISSKAPAFTMEGARAWHNPRAFSAGGYQNPSYQPAGQTPASRGPWQRPVSPTQPPVPRADLRTPSPAAVQRPAARPFIPAQRFGPSDQQTSFQQDDGPRPVDYRPAAPVQADYRPPVQDTRAPQPSFDYRAPDYAQDYRPACPPKTMDASYPRDPYVQRDAAPRTGLPEMTASAECGDGAGVLETHPDGYGFLRAENFLPGRSDVYISNAQIRRFRLRTGDYVEGKTRPQREGDRYSAMLYITKVNDVPVDDLGDRLTFDSLTAIYPKKRMTLSQKSGADAVLRQIDLLCPLGFGQRTLVVDPCPSGNFQFLKTLTDAISQRHTSATLMLLLIDERPEEVTLMRERVKGEVLYANIDEPPENQIRVSELALERAMRLVEQKRDVVIIVDSLTRLARAYNIVAPQNARILPCGLAASALSRLKHLFGAARMTKEGGSLTMLALATAGLQNPTADFVIDAFRTVANAEWTLLGGEKDALRMDLNECHTLHDELLLSEEEQALAGKLRHVLAAPLPAQGASALDRLFAETDSNEALNAQVDEYLSNQNA